MYLWALSIWIQTHGFVEISINAGMKSRFYNMYMYVSADTVCVYNEGKFLHAIPKHCFVGRSKNNPVKVFIFSLSPSASCFIHSPTVVVLRPSSFLANL